MTLPPNRQSNWWKSETSETHKVRISSSGRGGSWQYRTGVDHDVVLGLFVREEFEVASGEWQCNGRKLGESYFI